MDNSDNSRNTHARARDILLTNRDLCAHTSRATLWQPTHSVRPPIVYRLRVSGSQTLFFRRAPPVNLEKKNVPRLP